MGGAWLRPVQGDRLTCQSARGNFGHSTGAGAVRGLSDRWQGKKGRQREEGRVWRPRCPLSLPCLALPCLALVTHCFNYIQRTPECNVLNIGGIVLSCVHVHHPPRNQPFSSKHFRRGNFLILPRYEQLAVGARCLPRVAPLS